MRAVLGIDAAWTPTQPSGVALAAGVPGGGWRLLGAAPSLRAFYALAGRGEIDHGLLDGPCDVGELLAAASALYGGPVDLVAVDMPLAHSAITKRRACDNLVSKAYGGRGCGTHSPSASRPGRISDDMREALAQAGYALRTGDAASGGLIEVYPHPALVELSGAAWRLPYKAAKVGRYWPAATQAQRRANLLRQWQEIVALLEPEVAGVTETLPPPEPDARMRELKAYEDTLDAVICTWVGICALEGRARAYGDEDSAIWVPYSATRPGVHSPARASASRRASSGDILRLVTP